MGRIKTKAQFFTIDALIALAIIILTIIVVAPILEEPKVDFSVSADILQSFSSLKIGEMNNSYAKQLISQGYISDQNKSLLDQIGEFYVMNITMAKQLTEEALSSISPNEDIGIWYGSELLASKNITPYETAKTVFTDRQVISGIGGGGGVTGFSARAFLSSSSRTDYFYFGGYVGEGNISALIEYQGNITSAIIELVIKDNFSVYVNSVNSGTFSGSSDDFTPVSYNLSIANFDSGENTIEIRGNNTHIAGGFIKITYDSEVTYEQPEKYHFPGIAGLINLYDGFYVPGNLTGLTVYLHFNNSVHTFLTIGSTQIFNDSSDGTAITITNSTLSSLLNYSNLSKKTIPLRFGMDSNDYVANNTRDIDVFSATDISGSMIADCIGESSACCNNFNCEKSQSLCESCGGSFHTFMGFTWCSGESSSCCAAFICTDNETSCNTCGGTFEDKIQDAKDANKLFIDMILNDTDNRVGLTAYSTSALDSNYHPLSDNNVSLKAEVDSWVEGGSTCICCGINKAVAGIVANSSSEKFQSIVMMSDGEANVLCAQQGTGNAKNDAIQAACDAYNSYGIKVYTIGFGSDADVATLTAMASCADGSYYSAVDDLAEIYEKIAEELIETAYYEQTIEVTGTFFSQLYPDSYIEFEYTKQAPPIGLVATIEKAFSTTDSGTFDLPTNSTVLETNVISYSGPRWTSKVTVNNNTVYNLSSYKEDFLKLGDPYSVNLPISFIQNSNNVTLRTGLSAGNDSEGSINNKIIYTISKGLTSYTSVSATADGCNWEVEFENTNLTMSIPSDYSGSETCKYSQAEKYCDVYSNCEGATDATQIATYNIFKLLDFDSDGKLDVELSEDNMQITTSNLEGVPFLYSTEVQVRKWR